MTMPDGPGGPPPSGYPGAATPPGPEPSYPPPGPRPSYPAPGPQSGYPPPGPPTYSQMAPVPPARSRRSGLVILGVLVIFVAIVGGALYVFRDRITGDVNSLQIGDCIDEPSGSDSISAVQHQPCDDPHDGEVILSITDPAANSAPYPGADYFRTLVRNQCLPAADTYLGGSLDFSPYSVGFFYPTSSSWTDANDRGVTCYLSRDDGSKITGSIRAGASASHSP